MTHPGTIDILKLAFKFARRELRSGLQGFWIFLTCLILGVGAIAIIGTLSVSIERGMTEQGQPLLGGDMEFSVIHRQLTAKELAHVQNLGTVSRVATMRGIATAGPDSRALVEVKAVDNLYPLYGKIELQNPGSFQPRLAKTGDIFGAFAESSILARMKIKPGAIVRMGQAKFVIHDIIKHEPDRIADGLILGPRLLISQQALKATGLVKPGSLVRWRYRVKLDNPNTDPIKLKQAAIKAFPDAGWRIRHRNSAAPGAKRFLERLTFFLSLTGLTALVIGGAGVGNAVRSFMQRHKNNIATLKCLGASSQLVLATYLTEIVLITLLGIAIGVAIGATLPLITLPFLKDLLPVPIAPAVEVLPLLQAAAFGLLVSIGFSLWPLAQAKDTPASQLFRGSLGQKFKLPQYRYIFAIVVTIALMVALAMFAFPSRFITGAYILGISASFIVLIGLARLLMWLAKRLVNSRYAALRPRRAVSRLAIANLYRPGAPTPTIVLALGLGLSLFVSLALVDRNVSNELKSAVPAQAPSFFFLDIQNSQLDDFRAFADKQKGVSKTGSAPMLRGRVQKLNGKPLKQVSIAPDVAWAFRGDRGITYSATIPEGSKITKGKWWAKDYDGPPQVSFVDEIARGAGLEIGDTVTVNILGRSITAKITSLRSVEWESLRINFVMVFSPGTLQGAPHTHLVTVTMDENQEDNLLAAVSGKYKAVTAIRIKDALDAVNNLLEKLLIAIRSASSITMITGILVLAGALASGLTARTYDAVVLKTFGATRTQLIYAFIYEYALLGLITAAFSILIGSAAAYGIIHYIMEMTWTFSLTTALITALSAMVLTVTAGLITTWRALTAKPARILRAE